MKIAIVTHKMVMGGIEKSLIQLCKKLNAAGIDVTLYLESLGGELYEELPKEIRIVHIFQNQGSMLQIVKNAVKRGKIRTALEAVRASIILRTSNDPVVGWEAIARYLPGNDVEYDYAFAYGAPISFSVVYVDYVLKARKKYVWVHNEPHGLTLSMTKYSYIYDNFDKILCVSKATESAMVEFLPSKKDRIHTFYNFIDKNIILPLGNSQLSLGDFDGVVLLTVGRLCHNKGQDIIPFLAKRLKENGHCFKWYCVGDGEERKNLEQEIAKLGVAENVILLGNLNNPYPYFKAADIYVQPSRFEGFGITIAEAKLFRLPIIATNFQGATEQLEPGVTGIIVNFDEEEIYKAIDTMLSEPYVCQRIRDNLKDDPKKCVSDLGEIIEMEEQ